MKRKIIFTVFLSVIILSLTMQGCNNTCPYISAPVGINPPTDNAPTEQTSSYGWTLYFNPMMLPFKIKLDANKGFYVEQSEDNEVVTPIGTFGISYAVSSPGTINGVNIGEGDFLVAITNKKDGTKQLFKIENHNKLRIILDGHTELNFQPGYAEIDVTNSTIKEITFSDLQHSYIENPTNRPIIFNLDIANQTDPTTFTTYSSQIPPESYIVVQNDLMPVADNNYITIANVDSLNKKESVSSLVSNQKKLVGGNTYILSILPHDWVEINAVDNFLPKRKRKHLY